MSDEYRRAMNALARETKMEAASAHRIEDELLQATIQPEIGSNRHQWLPPLGGRSRPPFGGRSWARIAAAILLIAGSLIVWKMTRPGPAAERTFAGQRSDRSSPPPEVLVEKTDPSPASHRKLPDTLRPSRTKRSPRAAQVVRPSGFVELPWSAGLPPFESGEIVRMEVPVAALPTYGIDISAGSASGPVEADVLIGQDGFARAIRLVASTARSTQ